MADARAEPVAEQIADESRLAVNDLHGAFGAVRNACPAAVAFFFVNMNDGSFHGFPSLLFRASLIKYATGGRIFP
jgi:hypothetical protein